MRGQASAILSLMAASVLYGQPAAESNVERVLQFRYIETEQGLQEAATMIRAMTEIRQLAIEGTPKSVVLRGSREQIAMADWLYQELDQPANRAPRPAQSAAAAKNEYRVSSSSDDVLRIFYLTHGQSVEQMQEMATAIRAIAEIRRLFTFNPARAIAIRGTAEQMAMADWLYRELDRMPPEVSAIASGELRAGSDHGEPMLMRVFYLSKAPTVRDLQEIATLVRSMTEVRRLFTYNTLRAVMLRGTAEQLAMASWLCQELNESADRKREESVKREYQMAGGGELVRVFYLNHVETVPALQEIATVVRKTTEVRRLFLYNTPRAMAVRGTAAQIAMAERLIADRNKP